MVSRSNQDGISKSNTAPQLTRIIRIDRNFKGHPQNKVNQKKLPQLKEFFSSFIWTKTNSERKVLENQKTKCVKTEVI